MGLITATVDGEGRKYIVSERRYESLDDILELEIYELDCSQVIMKISIKLCAVVIV